MFSKRKKYLFVIGSFFLAFYLLPNLINFREQRFFSENTRLENAKALSKPGLQVIEMVPGAYYQRGRAYNYWFGQKNRELWTTPVPFNVFNYDTVKGGLVPYEIGGSQQTISIRLTDSQGKHWVLRSVNKDQKNVLPWWLQPSLLRSVFRDQVSAMNPYGAKVVAQLAAALHLPHTEPELYWMPYVAKHTKYNERIAGRVVYLEQHIDDTWKQTGIFGNAISIHNTEELKQITEKQKIPVDTLMYLKTRLFDMLINDWDRHEDQWRWALADTGGKKILRPIAKDRDMAFYVFDEGVLNNLAIQANKKFQSFRKEFGDISGLMHQSEKMDRDLLKGISKHQFVLTAGEITSQLDTVSINNAFAKYPPAIYQKWGNGHKEVFLSRLSQLSAVAAKFHELINAD